MQISYAARSRIGATEIDCVTVRTDCFTAAPRVIHLEFCTVKIE